MRSPIARLIAVLAACVLFECTPQPAFSQNVGVGTATVNNSALLQIETTAKGFLAPRMSNAQMLLVASPATSDIVYNTTYANFYYYTGTVWTPMVGGNNWSLTGNSGTSASTNFLGTKDGIDLVQKTDYNERLRVFNGGNVGLTNVTGVAEALQFYDPSSSGSIFTGFKAGVQVGSVHYIWPLAGDGTANQVLATDAAGNLSWYTMAFFGQANITSLWSRGGTYSLQGIGAGDNGKGKYSIAAAEYCSTSGDGDAAFGDSNSVSAKEGAISGGADNTVSGNGGGIVRGGAWNTAGSQNTMTVGGLFNSTSGQDGTILGGDSNNTSGAESVIINGDDNT
ncbi:MAG TPA: hypothetical protein VG537_02185, partial [Candidatus Kapabacteria bacterium]|nr:hypothetical protein [Candidatus Kapabacteria bacterium]